MEEAAGGSVTYRDSCTLANARRVAAMLDMDPAKLGERDPLPRGWHFILLGADTRRSSLREDGFPGLGVPMPDFGLPRLVIGGRTVEYRRDLPIGAAIHRTSAIVKIKKSEEPSGPRAAVTIGHELRVEGDGSPAIIETQTYILTPKSMFQPRERQPNDVGTPLASKIHVPDATLLFQYSALGFNSHKIHLDRTYSRDVEGFPDLVVNGGLTTLLLTEFARRELGIAISSVRIKFLSPLFCGRQITLAADRDEGKWRLTAHDDVGETAAIMELETR